MKHILLFIACTFLMTNTINSQDYFPQEYSLEYPPENSSAFCFENNECCDTCMERSHPFYVKVLGGVNFLTTTKSGGIQSIYHPGYIVSGSLGYRWCHGLRFEVEYAYRRNTFKRLHFFGRNFPLQGRFQSSSYMANVLWDIPVSEWGFCLWGIEPFIGVGIGYDSQRTHGTSDTLIFAQCCDHFSWQVRAGLTYPIFCRTYISLEYLFHQGGLSSIDNHSLGLGLTYDFW